MEKFVNPGENNQLTEIDVEKFQNYGVEKSLNDIQQAVVYLMDASLLLENAGLNLHNYNTLLIASDLAQLHTKLKTENNPSKINLSQETYQNILKEIRTMSLDDEDDLDLDKSHEQ